MNLTWLRLVWSAGHDTWNIVSTFSRDLNHIILDNCLLVIVKAESKPYGFHFHHYWFLTYTLDPWPQTCHFNDCMVACLDLGVNHMLVVHFILTLKYLKSYQFCVSTTAEINSLLYLNNIKYFIVKNITKLINCSYTAWFQNNNALVL